MRINTTIKHDLNLHIPIGLILRKCVNRFSSSITSLTTLLFAFSITFLCSFNPLHRCSFSHFSQSPSQSPSQPLSQPLSQSFSQSLSKSLSLHSPMLTLCVVSLSSNDYTFDLPSFFRSLLIFFKLILLLSLTPLAITHTLSITHYFNSHSFISLLLSIALLSFNHAFGLSLVHHSQ